MAETIKGAAVVWSVQGVAFTAGILSATNEGFLQSASITLDSDVADIRDGGQTKGKVFYNKKRTVSITVVPCDATAPLSVSTANTSYAAWMPATGTTITVTDSVGNLADSYNLISATGNRTVDGVATVDMTLEAFVDYEITTPVS